MPRQLRESSSLVEHIESLSFLAGALEASPGNQDLVNGVDAVIAKLKALQVGQYQTGDNDWRLRGRQHMLLTLADPLVRQLEQIEKTFRLTPEGKSWTPIFESTAAAILRSTQEEKLTALQSIDEVVSKPGCPEPFKVAGKQYHGLHKQIDAVALEQTKNGAQADKLRQQAVPLKQESNATSEQIGAHLVTRGMKDAALLDAHFKPAPQAKPKKKEVTNEELVKQNAELTAELAQAKAQIAALSAAIGGLSQVFSDIPGKMTALETLVGLAPAPQVASPQTNPVITGAGGA